MVLYIGICLTKSLAYHFTLLLHPYRDAKERTVFSSPSSRKPAKSPAYTKDEQYSFGIEGILNSYSICVESSVPFVNSTPVY